MAGRLYVTKTHFQVFEDVLEGKGWWKRWMQWLFDYWGHEENTGLGEVSVHCIGDILVCGLIKMQSALSCWHAVSPDGVLVTSTGVLELALHRAEMTVFCLYQILQCILY